MQSRLMYNFGHVKTLQDRKLGAEKVFQNLFTTQFKEDAKMTHCMGRLDRGAEDFAKSIAGGVEGMTVSFQCCLCDIHDPYVLKLFTYCIFSSMVRLCCLLGRIIFKFIFDRNSVDPGVLVLRILCLPSCFILTNRPWRTLIVCQNLTLLHWLLIMM